MTFPTSAILDITVQAYYSDAWQAITADVFGRAGTDPIGVTRGRTGEGARSVPTRMHLSLNNGTSKVNPSIAGRYSPRNPSSDLYGLIGRNTQVRAYVGTEHLGAGGGSETASTSHVAPSVTATGAGIVISGWLSGSLGNYFPVPGTEVGESDGAGTTMSTGWDTVASAGATGTKTATFSSSQVYASGTVVLHGASVAVEETLSGTSTTCDDITLTTDAATEVGWWLVAVQGWGRGLEVQMPDAPAGDDGGWVLLADSPIIGESGSTPSYQHVRIWVRRVNVAGEQAVIFGGVAESDDLVNADNHAVLYVLSGVDDWDIRATCEVPAWPARWDVSGADVSVPVEAAGILRRLQAGAKPLRSAMRSALSGRVAVSQAGADLLPVRYWPLEDAEGSTTAAPGRGSAGMTVSGGQIAWAQVSSPGSAPGPDMRQSTGTLAGGVSGVVGPDGSWSVGALVQYGGTDAWTCWSVLLAGGPHVRLAVAVGSSVTVTAFTDSGSSSLLTEAVDLSDGEPHYIEVWVSDVGSDVDYELHIDGVTVDTASVAGTPGSPTQVRVHPRGSGDSAMVAHLGVWQAPVPGTWTYLLSGALGGHAGEVAGRRIERLCRQEGIPLCPVGDLDETTAMGPQGLATLLDLVRECEDADGGVLYEPREMLALGYRTGRARCNLPVTVALDYSASELAPPLEPIDDDRYLRNEVTASRVGGSEATYEVTSGPLSTQAPPDGVGRYDTSVTLNVASDAQLPDQASWRAHLGTVDEARWPAIRVDLARLGADGKHALARSCAAVDVGDRITIANPPAWLPPDTIDQQVEGSTEVLGQYVRHITWVGVPASPWTVAVVGSAELGRVAAVGSTVLDALTSSGLYLALGSTARNGWWTESVAYVPMPVRVGAERVTVAGIYPAGADLYQRIVSAGWGTATTGQAWTTSGGSSSDYSVEGG